jgi:hypothetical protein
MLGPGTPWFNRLALDRRSSGFVRLSRSDLYNQFRQAFVAGTCLPLRLRPVNFWGLAH